jgi:hypothetical protein
MDRYRESLTALGLSQRNIVRLSRAEWNQLVAPIRSGLLGTVD